MIIYRPHRGRLTDSLALAQVFPNETAMKEYIVGEFEELFNIPLFYIDDIVISDHIYNEPEIGWQNTRYVCVKRMGKEDYMEKYGVAQCIGMCATIFPSQK